MGQIDIAWCPGCGNFPILRTLKEALAELDLDPAGRPWRQQEPALVRRRALEDGARAR